MEKRVPFTTEKLTLRRIIADHRDHNFCGRGNVSQRVASRGTQLLGKTLGRVLTRIIESDNGKAALLQATRHICPHPACSDKSDRAFHKTLHGLPRPRGINPQKGFLFSLTFFRDRKGRIQAF